MGLGLMANGRQAGDDWERIWDARLSALKQILGNPEDSVFHAAFPFEHGGLADVVTFSHFVDGKTYVTADLTGPGTNQRPSSLGNYELMVCVREETPELAEMISQLAAYTREAALEPGDTMEFGDKSSDSAISALFFIYPGEEPLYFEFLGQRYGLLLCVGITAEELALTKEQGNDLLWALLKERGVFPYTDLDRQSVSR